MTLCCIRQLIPLVNFLLSIFIIAVRILMANIEYVTRNRMLEVIDTKMWNLLRRRVINVEARESPYFLGWVVGGSC